MERIWNEAIRVGLPYQWGMPASLWPIPDEDLPEIQQGFPFGFYANGGLSTAQTRHVVAALYRVGMHQEADELLRRIGQGRGGVLALVTVRAASGARTRRQGEVIARILAYVIAGHHAGLDNWEGGLKARLASSDSGKEFDDAMGAVPAPGILRPQLPAPDLSRMPVDAQTGIPGSFALWVRMLFSALVDAAFLDTEAFMNAGKSAARDGFASLDQLSKAFDAHMQSVAVQADPTPVNVVRTDVLRQCRDKAPRAPGVFTLTVPTGGGKTLSSLAFALRHAVPVSYTHLTLPTSDLV